MQHIRMVLRFSVLGKGREHQALKYESDSCSVILQMKVDKFVGVRKIAKLPEIMEIYIRVGT